MKRLLQMLIISYLCSSCTNYLDLFIDQNTSTISTFFDKERHEKGKYLCEIFNKAEKKINKEKPKTSALVNIADLDSKKNIWSYVVKAQFKNAVRSTIQLYKGSHCFKAFDKFMYEKIYLDKLSNTFEGFCNGFEDFWSTRFGWNKKFYFQNENEFIFELSTVLIPGILPQHIVGKIQRVNSNICLNMWYIRLDSLIENSEMILNLINSIDIE